MMSRLVGGKSHIAAQGFGVAACNELAGAVIWSTFLLRRERCHVLVKILVTYNRRYPMAPCFFAYTRVSPPIFQILLIGPGSP